MLTTELDNGWGSPLVLLFPVCPFVFCFLPLIEEEEEAERTDGGRVEVVEGGVGRSSMWPIRSILVRRYFSSSGERVVEAPIMPIPDRRRL